MQLIRRDSDGKYLMCKAAPSYAWDINPCYAIPLTGDEIHQLTQALPDGRYTLVGADAYWHPSAEHQAMKQADIDRREEAKRKKAEASKEN